MIGCVGTMAAEDWVNLWPGVAPGAPQPAAGSETVREGQRFTDIEVPQYQLFQPQDAKDRNGLGVVILPGGGYTILAMAHEGVEIGEWCAQRGITAMVVKYRVSGKDSFGYQFPVPQLDARRALRIMRSQAEEWGVDAEKIGVMGASAGGHLASTCATMFKEPLETGELDAVDQLSCRPDFAVLLYPVIGIDSPWGHGGSARRLLGEIPTPELRKRCATHLHVTPATPPIFLVHASDDHSVPLQNTAEFMMACARQQVPVRAAIFPTGGHGFGAQGRGSAAGWMLQLEGWLEAL